MFIRVVDYQSLQLDEQIYLLRKSDIGNYVTYVKIQVGIMKYRWTQSYPSLFSLS